MSAVLNQTQFAPACPRKENDPYCTNFVKSAFESYQFSERGGGYSGAQMHQFNNNPVSLPGLGDRVSIAVLKLYGMDELSKPESTQVYLVLLLFAFSHRDRVVSEPDREPQVTLLLLDNLEQRHAADPSLRKKIAYFKYCVQDFSCSGKNETDYLTTH
jgi:hypothetical protein